MSPMLVTRVMFGARATSAMAPRWSPGWDGASGVRARHDWNEQKRRHHFLEVGTAKNDYAYPFAGLIQLASCYSPRLGSLEL